MSTISVAMIVLNEEDNIQRCLKSIKFADEIVIIDGGSSDGTLSEINRATIHGDLVVKHNPWPNHFGMQRQISFEFCTSDWIMRVDADEVISNTINEQIREILESLTPEIMNVRIRQVNLYPDIEHYAANRGGWETHPRIFRKRKDLEWVGHIHEYVKDSHLNCVNWSIPIWHCGWLNKERYYRKGIIYSKIAGSGFTSPEELVDRNYVIKPLPNPMKQEIEKLI